MFMPCELLINKKELLFFCHTELPAFPSYEQERKYTVKIGDEVRLECRYSYHSHELIFQWSKVKSVRNQRPFEFYDIVPNDRIIIGLDG